MGFLRRLGEALPPFQLRMDEYQIRDCAGSYSPAYRLLSPAYLTGLEELHEGAQRLNLGRAGPGDRFPLRVAATGAEIDDGDVPERHLAVVGAGSNGPARHLRDGVVDGPPSVLALVVRQAYGAPSICAQTRPKRLGPPDTRKT